MKTFNFIHQQTSLFGKDRLTIPCCLDQLAKMLLVYGGISIKTNGFTNKLLFGPKKRGIH